jgi:uroporphyrinogen decarboxylase
MHTDPLLLRALLGEETKEMPVWLMRQAGRYLPEYRALKEKYTFNQLSEDPNLAFEVTVQPLKRFSEIDAAILFADIMSPSKALGFEFEFTPGPHLQNPIRTPEDVDKLEIRNIEETNGYIFETLRMLKEFLISERKDRRALLGFAASPWTLACYLIHQGQFKQHLGTSVFRREHPEAFENLLDKICTITLDYLKLSHRAGADAVQIFDTWASIIPTSEYEGTSGKWIKRIVNSLKEYNIPVIVYAQADLNILKSLASYTPTALSVDWRLPLSEIRKELGNAIVLQGNMDPSYLWEKPETIKSAVKSLYKYRTKNIANLGHGLLPGTPIDGVKAYLEAVKSL